MTYPTGPTAHLWTTRPGTGSRRGRHRARRLRESIRLEVAVRQIELTR